MRDHAAVAAVVLDTLDDLEAVMLHEAVPVRVGNRPLVSFPPIVCLGCKFYNGHAFLEGVKITSSWNVT